MALRAASDPGQPPVESMSGNQHIARVAHYGGAEEIVRLASEMLTSLGFDSITSYVWIHHAQLDNFPETDYMQVCREYLQFCENIEKEINLP